MAGFKDQNMILSDNQSLYSASGVTDRESTKPQRLTQEVFGGAAPLYLNVQIATACAARSSAGSLRVKLQDSADDGSGSAASWADTSIETQTVTITNLTKGFKVLSVALPADTREWIKLEYEALTMSAGGIDAWLHDSPLS